MAASHSALGIEGVYLSVSGQGTGNHQCVVVSPELLLGNEISVQQRVPAIGNRERTVESSVRYVGLFADLARASVSYSLHCLQCLLGVHIGVQPFVEVL